MKILRALRSWKTLTAAALAVTAAAFFWPREDRPADPRVNGAYSFADGGIVVVVSRTADTYRAVLPATGEARALFPTGGRDYHSGPGWAGEAPVEVRVTFELGADGEVTGLVWRREGGEPERARKLELREEVFTFASGELTLRGKLVTPPGDGPFPAVVLVHGSESYSAVDYYRDPYVLAAHGFAALAYDKRGTGRSQGKYTQDFRVLAGDAVAAVAAVAGRPRIDRQRIHLAGFSQGGWIAPLAAAESPVAIAGVVVAYGTPLPVTEEDRWGYVYQLRRRGFGEEAIRQADEINAVIAEIVDEGRGDRVGELRRRLEEYRDAPWLAAVRGSDSALGFLSGTRLPLKLVHLYFKNFGPAIDRTYSSAPVLEELDVPMLWVFGGEDSSLPTPASIATLEEIKARLGKPYEIVLFPDAEHGILRFEEGDDGERRILGLEPGYYGTLLGWLRRQHDGPAGLPGV